jgi:hypothetical protein
MSGTLLIFQKVPRVSGSSANRSGSAERPGAAVAGRGWSRGPVPRWPGGRGRGSADAGPGVRRSGEKSRVRPAQFTSQSLTIRGRHVHAPRAEADTDPLTISPPGPGRFANLAEPTPGTAGRGRLCKHVPVLGTDARESTTTFVQRSVGEVLLAWENEAFLALEELGQGEFEIVVPSLSILAEPSVTLVDHVVDKYATRKVAQAYLEYLYSPTGQRLAAKYYYRPTSAEAADPADLRRFPKVQPVTIQAFGGWQKAQSATSLTAVCSTRSPRNTAGRLLHALSQVVGVVGATGGRDLGATTVTRPPSRRQDRRDAPGQADRAGGRGALLPVDPCSEWLPFRWASRWRNRGAIAGAGARRSDRGRYGVGITALLDLGIEDRLAGRAPASLGYLGESAILH